MTRRGLLLLLAGGANKTDDRIFKAHSRFATACNKWAKFANALSPASPDFIEQLRETWQGLEISEKFRRLERELGRGPAKGRTLAANPPSGGTPNV